MNRPWAAATYVGRIGGLAVALGVGAAVATGTGVAWADTADSTANSSEQASAAPAGSSTSQSPARRGGRGSAPARSKPRPSADSLPAAADLPTPTHNAAKNDSPKLAPEPAAATAAAAKSPDPQPVSREVLAPAPKSAAATPRTLAALTDLAPLPSLAAPAAAVVLPAAVVPRSVLADAPVLAIVPAQAAAAPAKVAVAAPRLARLLSAVGLAPLAGGTLPGGPVDAPALWALLGWTRSESSRTRSAAAGTALPSAAVATAAAVTPPSTLPSTPVGWVTGQRNTAYPGIGWTQTNNTQWANIYGTDLGIMWFNGDNQLTQLAFGDTFSGPNMTGDWRSNVLLLSNDLQLNDGLSLVRTGPAYQFIPAAPGQVFFIGSEVTNIPTSAVYANKTNYVNYMSVKSWDTPGRWTTNYSAISQYDPKTDKWVLQKQTVRPAGYFRSSTMYQAGDQNFQQMAYVVQPESKVTPGAARYVYAFGTPAGRAGSAYLSRVPEGAVTDLKQYEYWDGNAWVKNQAKAAPVIGDSTKSTGLLGPLIDLANDPNFLGGSMAGFLGAKTGGNVSEMSIQYNEYLDKYVVLYGNGSNNVILRTADTPEGPWSDPVTIATSVQYPGLYAPMIHPLSGTGKLTDGTNPDVSNLYWNMSLWGNYNVVLMKTDLSPLNVTTV